MAGTQSLSLPVLTLIRAAECSRTRAVRKPDITQPDDEKRLSAKSLIQAFRHSTSTLRAEERERRENLQKKLLTVAALDVDLSSAGA